jgi:N-acetylglucosaminyl-diphospho-decaprenol L-rhamnosyltransferase
MIKLSVIVVNYKADAAVARLLASLPNKPWLEVIVMDNSVRNVGFGKAINLAVQTAKGTYILLLNPDCEILPGAIEALLKKAALHKQIGIVGPQLVDHTMTPYISFSRQPTKLGSPWVMSFLNTLFPNTIYSKYHEYNNCSLNAERQVESISGAAMLIPAVVFREVGGFDERFFLYWEDYDISARIRAAGYSIVYFPVAKVIHHGGYSASQEPVFSRYAFRSSRFAFFSKYHGLTYATLLEAWLVLTEEWRLWLILLLAAFLRFDRLVDLMPLIGDQGRDMLAALDGLKSGTLPLLGIPSSVPRFAQGPLTIWLFMGVFSIFGTDPVWAGLLAALLGLLVVFGVYLAVEWHFGKLAATLAALFLALSPLAVTQSRLAYHTNPIPLMSLLFLLALWRQPRNGWSYFWVGLTFALLFQFELAAVPLLALVALYVKYEKSSTQMALLLKARAAVAGIFIGLLPQVIYDLTHGFKQLGLFGVWLGYRLISFFGFDPEHVVSPAKASLVFNRFAEYGTRFLAHDAPYLALSLLLLLLYHGILTLRKPRLLTRQVRYLWGWIFFLILGFLIHGGPSEAYFPTLFVPVAMLMGIGITVVPYKVRVISIALFLVVFVHNALTLYQHDYFVANTSHQHTKVLYGQALESQMLVILHLKQLAQGKEVVFDAIGPGSEHASSVDNYRLLWQLYGSQVHQSGLLRVYVFTDDTDYVVPGSVIYRQHGIVYAVMDESQI